LHKRKTYWVNTLWSCRGSNIWNAYLRIKRQWQNRGIYYTLITTTYFSHCSYQLLFSFNAYMWYWINYAHFVFILSRDIVSSVHLIVILVAIRWIDVYSVQRIIKRFGSLFIGLKTLKGILSYDKIQYCCRCYHRADTWRTTSF